MSLAFNRSLRALAGDRHGPSLISLIGASLLLLAWLGWFTLARVPVYSVSQELHLARSGAVLAHFEPAALALIRPGQQAKLLLRDPGSSATRTVAAVVSEVPRPGQYGPDRDLVRLYLLDPTPLDAPPLSARVQVETISPMALVGRSLDQHSLAAGDSGGGS